MIFPAQTSRLVLRAWREDDFDAFAAMNADPRVMEYFPAPLTREESAAFFGHIREEFQTEGFGLYAVERISDGLLLGYTGLHRVTFDGLCGQIEVIWAAACRRLGQRLRPGSRTGVPCARGKTRHRGGDSLHRRHQPALAAGHAKNRHGVRGPVQPPYPAGRTSPAAACALLDRNQGIDSVNGQARSRIAAEYPGAADAGNDNPRKLDGLRGLLPFRAEAPPGGLARGKAAAAFPLHAFIPQRRFRDAHAAGIISARNRQFRGCRPTRRRHKR